jgi:dipeptidyl aminopeptidase/acylaminoacyl peptidase
MKLVGRCVALAACAWLSVNAEATSTPAHVVTYEDLLKLRRVDELALSPDGATLAFVDGAGDLWTVTVSGSATPLQVGHGLYPVWSPDSQQVAYYSSVSGSNQIWVFDRTTGASTQVTHLEGGVNPDPKTEYIGLSGWHWDSLHFSWSPDSARIVFPSQVAIVAEKSGAKGDPRTRSAQRMAAPELPLVLTTTTPPEWTVSGILRGDGFETQQWRNGEKASRRVLGGVRPLLVDHLFILDVQTGSVRQLTKDTQGYFSPSWSPDGAQIICVSNEGRALLDWGSGPTNLYLIDVETGSKRALTKDGVFKRMPMYAWSPDGKWVAFFGADASDISREDLYVISKDGNTRHDLSLALDHRVLQAYWSSDSGSLTVNYDDGVQQSVARIDAQTQRVQVLSGEASARRWPMAASYSGTVAWAQSDPSHHGAINVLVPKEAGSRVLLDLNPQIQDWQLGSQDVVHWVNHRGDHLEGVLLKPVNFRPGERYPLIVDGYPQQGNSFKGVTTQLGTQVWASKGYVVFWPDARAPHVWSNPFKSSSYDSAAKGPNGWNVTLDDVMSGVEELIRRGIVDPERMALSGFSNGGAVVNNLVSRTDRFKCAVSLAAASTDWVRSSLLGNGEKYNELRTGTTVWDDPDTFIKLSAVFRANKIKTPMLLADGDEDGDFLLSTIEMYKALRRFGDQVTLLRYPGQGHEFTGAALRDFLGRRDEFLQQCLEPPVGRK